MLTSFYSPHRGELSFLPGLPSHFLGPFLPGSSFYFESVNLGTIVVQQIKDEDFSMQYYSFLLSERITLSAKGEGGFQAFYFHNGGSRSLKVNRSKTRMREAQFLLFHSEPFEWKLEIPKGKPLHLLSTVCRPGLAAELAAYFPGLDVLFHPGSVMGPVAADANIRDTVHRLLHAEYEPSRLPFYFQNKAREYLFLLLDRAAIKAKRIPLVQASAWEEEAMYKIRELILADILQHYSVKELAQRFKLTEFRCKYFFKQEFGVGPYEFLLNARIDRARELLEAGEEMKNAAQWRATGLRLLSRRSKGVMVIHPAPLKRGVPDNTACSRHVDRKRKNSLHGVHLED
jgi:AraC-like DNA-binding protein